MGRGADPGPAAWEHTMSRWDGISITAHYTAQIWVKNGLAYAWPFDTARGRLMYNASLPLFQLATSLGLNTPLQFCIQRHRIIDHLIEGLRPRQVVELGGGLSPRCLALCQKEGIRAIDVDLPAMVRYKASRIGPHFPSEYHQQALDIVESRDYVADLGPVLRPLSPTVVVTEGLLSYFSPEQRQGIFEKIAALLRHTGGGMYVTDMHHQEAVDRMGKTAFAFRTALHHLTGTVQTTLIQDFAEGEARLLRAGFSSVRCHEPADFVDELGLVVKDRSSGLSVYEAHL